MVFEGSVISLVTKPFLHSQANIIALLKRICMQWAPIQLVVGIVRQASRGNKKLVQNPSTTTALDK